MVFADYPGHAWAAVIFTGIVGVLLAVYAPGWRRMGRAGHISAALTAVCAAALVLLLWNPSQPVPRPKEAQVRGAVFFDTSLSMAVNPESASRLEQAVKAFETHAAAFPQVQWDVYGFDDTVYRAGDARALGRYGNTTDLRAALETAQEKTKDAAFVLLFTDGGAAEREPELYAGLDFDQRLLITAVDAEREFPDVSIGTLTAPDQVFAGSVFQVSADVTARGFAGPLKLSLYQDDTLVETRTIEISEQAAAHVTFYAMTEKAGERLFSLRTPALEGEADTQDNVSHFFVQTHEPRTLRVLLYAQRMSFDLGKISSALIGYGNVQVQTRMDVFAADIMGRKAHAAARTFPAGELEKYDLVILGPLEPGSFGNDDAEPLYRYVNDRAGAVIFLPPVEQDMPVLAEVFQTLLPVRFETDSEQQGPPTQNIFSPAGFDPAAAPKLIPAYENLVPKASARVIPGPDAVPAAVMQRLGAGHTCLLNSAMLYRWFAADSAGGLLGRLLCALASEMVRPVPQGGIRLQAERLSDSRRRLDAVLRDAEDAPITGANVIAAVADETHILTQGHDGIYSGIVNAMADGILTVQVSARKEEIFLGTQKRSFVFDFPSPEMDRAGGNAAFLRELAAAVNGRCVNLNDIGEMDLKALLSAPAQGELRFESRWRKIWIFVSLSALFLLNWWIRRRNGLA